MNSPLRIFIRLSPAECVDALLAAIRDQPAVQVTPTLTMRKQIVDGKVSESRVRLFVRDQDPTLFTGKFSATDGGTLLEGAFHLPITSRFFSWVGRVFAMLLGFGGSGLILTGMITSPDPIEPVLIFGIFIFSAFAVGMLFFIAYMFRIHPERLDGFIRGTFESTADEC